MNPGGRWIVAAVLVSSFGLAASGCIKSEAPSCEQVVDHKISIFSGEIKRLAESNREALIKKCATMSDRERKCVVDAINELDLGKCEQDKKRKKKTDGEKKERPKDRKKDRPKD